MSPEKIISVVLADTHFLTIEALQSLLGRTDGYSVTGVAKSPSDLTASLGSTNPDLLVIDTVNLPLDSKLIVLIKDKFPHLSWLILTDTLTRMGFDELIQSGIRNIVYKNTEKEELLTALEATLKGKKFFSDEVLELALGNTGTKIVAETPISLTTSEIDIVRMIANGLTTKEIALKKNISHHTVNTHRKNIFRKMGVSNSSELILNAIKAGWIDNIEYFI